MCSQLITRNSIKVIYQRTGGAGKQPSAAIAIFYYCVRSGTAYALHELVERDTGSIYPALGMLLAGGAPTVGWGKTF